MTTLTIRNLPEDAQRALRARAKRNARSTEAEVRAIIQDAVLPKKSQKGIGTSLLEFGRKHGPFEVLGDASSTDPADFS